MQPDQLAIHADRGGTGRQAEHGRTPHGGTLANEGRNLSGHVPGGRVGVGTQPRRNAGSGQQFRPQGCGG